MGVILDTSVLVAAERGRVALGSLLGSLADESVGIAAVTASELLHGCHRAKDPAVQVRRFAFVESLLDIVPVFEFGLVEARRHAELWARLVSGGTPIGSHDMLIAASCLARGFSLATLNTREFTRVVGLRLISLDSFMESER